MDIFNSQVKYQELHVFRIISILTTIFDIKFAEHSQEQTKDSTVHCQVTSKKPKNASAFYDLNKQGFHFKKDVRLI